MKDEENNDVNWFVDVRLKGQAQILIFGIEIKVGPKNSEVASRASQRAI